MYKAEFFNRPDGRISKLHYRIKTNNPEAFDAFDAFAQSKPRFRVNFKWVLLGDNIRCAPNKNPAQSQAKEENMQKFEG